MSLPVTWIVTHRMIDPQNFEIKLQVQASGYLGVINLGTVSISQRAWHSLHAALKECPNVELHVQK